MEQRFVKRLLLENIICESELPQLRYGMTVARNELIKGLLLLLIFWKMGYLLPFLFLIVVSVPMRMCTGGIHLNSNVGCFLLSFLLLFMEMAVLPELPIGEHNYIYLLEISVLLIALFPPVGSPHRPMQSSSERFIINKGVSCLLCVFWFFILGYHMWDPYLMACGVWALCIQAVQLILVNIKKGFDLL